MVSSVIDTKRSVKVNLSMVLLGALVLSCLLIILSFPSSSAAKTYYLSVIPMYAPEALWNYYAPLVDYLNKKTSKRWELKLVPNHSSLIDSLCKKEIDIAFTGPVPFLKASELCSVNPLVVALGKEGRPYYRAVIFASDQTLRDLRSLANKSFGYLRGSTLAHIAPFKMLYEAGVVVDPVRYKRQEDIVRDVMTGKIKAGGVKQSVFDKFAAQNIHIIKHSEDVPMFLFFSHGELDKGASELFVKALTELKPLKNKRDKDRTAKWDDEAKYGFVQPDRTYMDRVNQLKPWINRFLKD